MHRLSGWYVEAPERVVYAQGDTNYDTQLTVRAVAALFQIWCVPPHLACNPPPTKTAATRILPSERIFFMFVRIMYAWVRFLVCSTVIIHRSLPAEGSTELPSTRTQDGTTKHGRGYSRLKMSKIFGSSSPERGTTAFPRLEGARGVIGVFGADGIATLFPTWAGAIKPEAAEQMAMATIIFMTLGLLICRYDR